MLHDRTAGIPAIDKNDIECELIGGQELITRHTVGIPLIGILGLNGHISDANDNCMRFVAEMESDIISDCFRIISDVEGDSGSIYAKVVEYSGDPGEGSEHRI